MKMTRLLPSLLLVLVFFTPIARADVEVTYDKSVNFSYIRSFDWTEGTPPEDPLMQKRIEAAIQRELIVKGFRKDDEEPDFLIAIHFDGDSVRVEMLDLESGEVFWQGIGTGAVPENEAKLERKINKAAAKMFRKFPPKQKSKKSKKQ